MVEMIYFSEIRTQAASLTLLHSERPKLNTILAFLSVIGLIGWY